MNSNPGISAGGVNYNIKKAAPGGAAFFILLKRLLKLVLRL